MLTMIETIEKYFKKTPNNIWAGWDDYLLIDYLNSKYGFFLRATLHIPKGPFATSNRLEDRMSKIILHRTYGGSETIKRDLEEGSSMTVYIGLIEESKDLEYLLLKLGIVDS